MAKQDKEFFQWLLTQLKNPELIEKVQKKIENSVVWDISDKDPEHIPQKQHSPHKDKPCEKEVSKPQESDLGVNAIPKSKWEEQFNLLSLSEKRRIDSILREHTYESNGYWTERLQETQSNFEKIRLGQEDQVVRMSLYLFEHLANFANALIYHRKHIRLFKSFDFVSADDQFVSDFELQRIYYYSKDLVFDYYNPKKVHIDFNRYFHFFVNVFGNRGFKDFKLMALARMESFEEIHPETYEVFGFTSQGMEKLWWDQTGELRKKNDYSTKTLNRFRIEPSRMTFVWEIEVLTVRILYLFDRVCDEIQDELKNQDILWRNLAMKRYVTSVVNGDMKVKNPKKYDLMSLILRICEAEIRKRVGGIPELSISNDLEEIKRKLPMALRQRLNLVLAGYQMEALEADDVFELSQKTRYATKIILSWIEEQNPGEEKVIELLNKLTEDDVRRVIKKLKPSGNLAWIQILLTWRERGKISKSKNSSNNEWFLKEYEPVVLEIINEPELQENLNEQHIKLSNEQMLKDFIGAHSTILESYVKKDAWISYHLFIQKAFIKPIKKVIQLNEDEIDKSRTRLENTIAMIDAFIETEDDGPNIDVDHSKEPFISKGKDATLFEEKTGQEKETLGSKKGSQIQIEKETQVNIGNEESRMENRADDNEAEIFFNKEEKALLRRILNTSPKYEIPMKEAEEIIKDSSKTVSFLIREINDKCYDEIGVDLVIDNSNTLSIDSYDVQWVEQKLGEENGGK